MTLSLGLSTNKSINRLANSFRNSDQNVVPAKEEQSRELQPDDLELEKDLRLHHRQGLATLVLTLSIIIIFAWIMPLAGAVVVGGTFVVHSSAKKIQHRTGGTVQEIYVNDGSKVKAGEKLMRLDDTEIKASFGALVHHMDEVRLRIARLEAERDGASTVKMPELKSPPEEQLKMWKAERDFFEARKQTQTGIQKIAVTRIEQLQKNIEGLEAQSKSNQGQQKITQNELAGVKQLFDKRIATLQSLTPLQRESERLKGNENQISASIREAGNKFEEIRLQAQQSKENFHAEVMHDLNEESAKNAQLLEQYVAVNQELAHRTIYAPVSGAVHELTVHTVGGVVIPADPLMTIIPDDDPLEVAVHLASDKIDQVHMGQRTRIKLTAFTRTTPDIEGAVSFISPDLVETKMGGSYYDVRIAVDQHPHGMNLSPGMPAEVFIKTEDRTVVSFLMKPLTEQWLPKVFSAR